MLISDLIVRLPQGLQARNSCRLVKNASSFNSEVTIVKNGISGSLDVMEIMDLNVQEGDEITLLVDGSDEQSAAEVLKKYLLDIE
ncbi:HPr family phosphocarrier protein [Domibacillus indicus]|uniref:HPr family phosphocarrier protein n=1 Tax=Domibacillus indicus TaxID=1437523 RepID=UPI000617CFFA|nr:HPr family phosphocarrier protein [Domibacillus indicus]